MKRIVVLHVFEDEKFFDSVSSFWDSLNGVVNLYHFYTHKNKGHFRYIKNIEKVKIFTDFQKYVWYFSSVEVDIIYFHGLSPKFYNLFTYIDKEKKVIWWCWGFEIYSQIWCLPPLVKINLYKPLTQQEVWKNSRSLKSVLRNVYHIFKYPYVKSLRKKVLQRIDYFSPVLPIEYRLMQQIQDFRAKPFLLGGPGFGVKTEFLYLSVPRNILIGNSLTYTNNHLDIFLKIRNICLNSRKYIIPINYGNAYNGDHRIFKKKANLPENQIIWLDDFLPFEQYRALFDSVTHAVFGQLRQQAMGNINMCLRRSIKIFLYKDSLIYRQLKEWGYIVYTIDEDLTEESLKTVLPKEIAFHNYALSCKLIDGQERLHAAEMELQSLFD